MNNIGHYIFCNIYIYIWHIYIYIYIANWPGNPKQSVVDLALLNLLNEHDLFIKYIISPGLVIFFSKIATKIKMSVSIEFYCKHGKGSNTHRLFEIPMPLN